MPERMESLSETTLRRAGWTIHSRPKSGEAIWRWYNHGKVVYEEKESAALEMTLSRRRKYKGFMKPEGG